MSHFIFENEDNCRLYAFINSFSANRYTSIIVMVTIRREILYKPRYMMKKSNLLYYRLCNFLASQRMLRIAILDHQISKGHRQNLFGKVRHNTL